MNGFDAPLLSRIADGWGGAEALWRLRMAGLTERLSGEGRARELGLRRALAVCRGAFGETAEETSKKRAEGDRDDG